MTTVTNAPAGPMAVRAAAAELLKLRTVRSTGWLLVAATVSIVAIAVANAIGLLVRAGAPSGEDGTLPVDPAGAALSGVGSALVLIAALGILSVTPDYSSGLIRTTIAAVPRRTDLVVGKTAAVVATVLPVMLGALLLAAVAVRLIVARAGLTLSLSEPGVLRALVGGALYLTVLAVFTAGIGWLLRSTAAALVVWLTLWILPTFLVMLLPLPLARVVGPLLPGSVGTAVYTIDGGSDGAGWTSLGIFAAYAVLILAVSVLVLRRRDA